MHIIDITPFIIKEIKKMDSKEVKNSVKADQKISSRLFITSVMNVDV